MKELATLSDFPLEIGSHFLDYLPPQGLLSLVRIIPHLLHFVSPTHSHVVSERGEILLRILAGDGNSEIQAVLLANHHKPEHHRQNG